MTHAQQVQCFVNDLDKLVERYRREFDLTYLDGIAVLEAKKLLLFREMLLAQSPPTPGGTDGGA